MRTTRGSGSPRSRQAEGPPSWVVHGGVADVPVPAGREVLDWMCCHSSAGGVAVPGVVQVHVGVTGLARRPAEGQA